MRRTALVILLFAVLAPAAALAGPTVIGDGTLSVRNGDGFVRLDLDRGVVIGRIGATGRQGLTLYAPSDTSCQSANVWDEGEQVVGETKLLVLDKQEVEACVYKGDNLRFRLIADDAATIRLAGDNISLSAVGRGRGQIRGRNGEVKQALNDGTYALNGGEYASLPDELLRFPLAGAIAPPE